VALARLLALLLFAFAAFEVSAQQREPIAPIQFIREEAIQIEDSLINVAWSPAGDQLLITGYEGIYLYDIVSEQITQPEFFADHTLSSVWNSDGSLAATLLFNGQVYIWDTATLSVVDEWQSHTHMSVDIAWSPDDSYIATSSWDDTVTIYSVEQRQQIATLSEDRNGEILSNVGSLDWNSDSNRLLFSTARSIVIWDVGSNEQFLQVHSNRTSGKIASWRPDGRVMAFGGVIPADWDIPAQAVIYLWETDAVRPLRTILIHDYGELYFYSLAWHPNNIWLASYNDDQQIRIWDTTTGQLIAQLLGQERFGLVDAPSYGGLAWSPDGTGLADVGLNGIVQVWQISPNIT
jgi:WD40 repeat protein